MKSSKKTNENGFTLVELVVVITIIGMLMAIAVPKLAAYRVMAEHSNVDQIANSVTTATLAYLSSSNVEKYIEHNPGKNYADSCFKLLDGDDSGFYNNVWDNADTGPNGSDIDYQKFMSNALQGTSVQNMSFVPAFIGGPAGLGNHSPLSALTFYKLANGNFADSYSAYNIYFVIFIHNPVTNSDEIQVDTQYKDDPNTDISYINGVRQP